MKMLPMNFLAVLAMLLSGCGTAGEGGPDVVTGAEMQPACELLTAAEVLQVTGYTVSTEALGSDGVGCNYSSAGGELYINLTVGGDVGEQADLMMGVVRRAGGAGVIERISSENQVVGLVYPDGTGIAFNITGGTALTTAGDIASGRRELFRKGDGSTVPIEQVAAGFSRVVRSRID